MATTKAASGSKNPILPPEDLSSILSSIELLSAMWSGRDELRLSPADQVTIGLLADYLQLPIEELGSDKAHRIKDSIGEQIVLALKVRADPQEAAREVAVNVEFTLRRSGAKGKGVRMWVSAKDAPTWLDRARVDQVNAILGEVGSAQGEDEDEEDTVGQILNVIENVSEYLLSVPVVTYDANTSTSENTQKPSANVGAFQATNVHRTWYYLPSLRTKSKRQDICNLALSSTRPLSGFLLSGKPGLIAIEYPLPSNCPPSPSTLQTASLAMHTFWSTIKTTSWSDLPGSHKKISEKFTEPNAPKAFSGFQDITDWPEVERGAERGSKSDLSKLIKWLNGKGVQGKCLIQRCLGVGSWQTQPFLNQRQIINKMQTVATLNVGGPRMCDPQNQV
ncbi:uncharacterized protein UHOD_05955 [Ustilago sp. UG-2017b]|nr:uncharacterized protein UHOD_05955 [Ustilago sp. UG-2017b]